jgi:hypothetical protein
MFFRRESAKTATTAARLENLRKSGFEVAPLTGGTYRVRRDTYAIDLKDEAGALRINGLAGVLMGNEIGSLVDGGYQKFFHTPTGRKKPALAEELKAIHDFEEDLREALGLKSLYNEALGTVSTYYMYDRVQDRDRGTPKRVWEK